MTVSKSSHEQFPSGRAFGKPAPKCSPESPNLCVEAIRSLHDRAWGAYTLQLRRAQALVEKARAILSRADFVPDFESLTLENLALRALCAALAQERSAAKDPELPRTLCDEALAGLTPSTPPAIAARVRYACADVATRRCEYDGAEAHLRGVLDLLPSDSDPRLAIESEREHRLRVDTLSAIGRIQHYRGEFLAALETQTLAWQLATTPIQQTRAMGQVRSTGHAATATRSLYLYGEATSLNRLGNLHERLADYSAAIDAHKRCLPLREALGDVYGRAITLNNLANVYLHIDQVQTALEYFGQALPLCREIGYLDLEAGVLSNMGLGFQLSGQLDDAINYHRAALNLNGRLNNRRNQANNLSNLGEALLLNGQLAEAQDCLERALRLNRESGDRHGITTCLTTLGRLFSEARDPFSGELLAEEAFVPLLEEALEEAGRTGALDMAVAVHDTFTEAWKRRGNFERALGHSGHASASMNALFKAQTIEQARTLQLRHEMEQSRKEAEIHRLRSVELAAALQEAQTQRRLAERLANEDVLTGMCSRRHGDRLLAAAFEDSVRTGNPLSIVLADADHFKAINDRYSHLTGDTVLRQLALICRETCRAGDVAVRFGGEELLFILPDTSLPEAVMWAETLRIAVENYAWDNVHAELAVRLSLGVTARPPGAARPRVPRPVAVSQAVDTLIRAADARLYEAKAAGRNCVRS